MSVDGPTRTFRRQGRVVVVGASLAGLRAAETLREEGFTGALTMIGDEPHGPYDRPPLSKQVLLGKTPADGTALPRRRAIDAEWRLGVAATGLDLTEKRVRLADGQEVGFDRLLIATGTRARPWPRDAEADLDGVFVLRTSDDAARLDQRLAARPRRVLVIGAGFTGSEVASACRERGLEVTVAERGPAPLVGALGGVIGAIAAELQREHGVDLRCCITVTALEGDPAGRLRRAHLSDGTALDVDVAVIALGAMRNTEWLAGSGLGAGPRGVACDAGCRAFDVHGIVTDDIFVAGDVARSPHPLFGYQFLSLEHWGNAVAQAETAAHNMISAGPDRRPHLWVPAFWSAQFGVNIKSVGVPPMGEEIAVTQGSLAEHRFAAAYGFQGRVIAAVSFDHARWIDFYRERIESAAPFPPDFTGVDRPPGGVRPVPADFPDPALPTHGPTVTLSGYSPSDRRVTFTPARA
ncbi:NADPH-dependent 2,4-dienoyl-CoA reductase/sulfur reductase-like enzyme [Streptosporangium album]|uniref:NADPH-dependent 2,4-dienoyl-CoA reductase/sulfur reductase-like enzyme n=1 Tax=Streptosporangium album TaxID=47479 RepID=A0A7W7RTJ3_9ACTN|nr:FAD-dependent oxidoreductase [Streptosporangium album]MBB4937938.1 NADPH-dependent 2,4-dienoyl-CoA reductase/sulfur reductase-like enzyme [Streptosporangium album]